MAFTKLNRNNFTRTKITNKSFVKYRASDEVNLQKDFSLNSKNIVNTEYLINNKIPIINADNSEQHLPAQINLIDLNAISFKKGCFLGQEIIARVHYKGKTKKHLYDKNFK